jgi:hypothetical protein
MIIHRTKTLLASIIIFFLDFFSSSTILRLLTAALIRRYEHFLMNFTFLTDHTLLE